MSHFLQSKAWGAFQESLGKQVFFQHGDGWQYLAILEKGRFNTRLYCPYGPVISKDSALSPALESLKQLGRKHGVAFLRVEPTGTVSIDQLMALHFRKVTYAKLQPEHTQIIDLSSPEDEIIANMGQAARNMYRNYSKKRLSIHSSSNPENIDILLTFLQSVAKRNRVSLQSSTYLKKQADVLMPLGKAKLFYVSLDHTPIAAALVYDSEHTRYYAHAGADDVYRKLQAGTALLAYMIIDAKRSGLQTFDLSGITLSENPNHPWAGFTRFKKSFGGEPRSYVGLWELPLRPLSYWFYRLLQKLLS